METESKLQLSQIKDLHAGRPGAILGGGPSLPADLARVPKDAILFGVNQHAMRLVDCDYHVVIDDLDLGLADVIKNAFQQPHTGLLVSPHPKYTEVEFDVPWWNHCRYSGCAATWFACWLGCDPVLLCGMDCYQGDQKYFYDWDYSPRNLVFTRPLEEHLEIWRQALVQCLHPERIRAVSGPLISIFGGLCPLE